VRSELQTATIGCSALVNSNFELLCPKSGCQSKIIRVIMRRTLLLDVVHNQSFQTDNLSELFERRPEVEQEDIRGKHSYRVETEGFWRCCTTFRITGGFWALSIIRNSKNSKTQNFRNWVSFRRMPSFGMLRRVAPHGVTSQKTALFIGTAVKTWNLTRLAFRPQVMGGRYKSVGPFRKSQPQSNDWV
jgi:hypothetical protein